MCCAGSSEAAAALDFAHSKGVVHRDVKPRNLLFDGLDRLVVADFGIARAAFEEQLTASGELLGTAAYISPEQTAGEPATPASDRYAFAVVAYEALTGGLPFGTGTLMEIAARRIADWTRRPRASVRRTCRAAVDDVLLRGLARDPAARWDTAGRFVQALEAAVQLAAGAARAGRRASEPSRAARPPTPFGWSVTARARHPVAAILLGVAAAVGRPDRRAHPAERRWRRGRTAARTARERTKQERAQPARAQQTAAPRSSHARVRRTPARRVGLGAQRPGLPADERRPLRRGDPGPAARGGGVPGGQHGPDARATRSTTWAARCGSPAARTRRSRSWSSACASTTSAAWCKKRAGSRPPRRRRRRGDGTSARAPGRGSAWCAPRAGCRSASRHPAPRPPPRP